MLDDYVRLGGLELMDARFGALSFEYIDQTNRSTATPDAESSESRSPKSDVARIFIIFAVAIPQAVRGGGTVWTNDRE